MASQVATQHWLSRNKAALYDVDADYSTAAVVAASVKDMRDYAGYVAIAMSSLLAGSGITLLELIGCEDSDGTGNITVIKTSGVVAADAVGDYVCLECTAQELRHLSEVNGYDLRYVAVRLTLDNSGDEVVLFVNQYGYRHGPSLNHTANAIS